MNHHYLVLPVQLYVASTIFLPEFFCAFAGLGYNHVYGWDDVLLSLGYKAILKKRSDLSFWMFIWIYRSMCLRSIVWLAPYISGIFQLIFLFMHDTCAVACLPSFLGWCLFSTALFRQDVYSALPYSGKLNTCFTIEKNSDFFVLIAIRVLLPWALH